MKQQFSEKYPKTMFAMEALASAVEEETAGVSQHDARAIAKTAITGTAMRLANMVIGMSASSEKIDSDTVSECTQMLLSCLDGIITFIAKEDKHEAN